MLTPVMAHIIKLLSKQSLFTKGKHTFIDQSPKKIHKKIHKITNSISFLDK